jgi:hypothetical protein
VRKSHAGLIDALAHNPRTRWHTRADAQRVEDAVARLRVNRPATAQASGCNRPQDISPFGRCHLSNRFENACRGGDQRGIRSSELLAEDRVRRQERDGEGN